MREGFVRPEKRGNTNNFAYYNLTYLESSYPTKAKVSYNLHCPSTTQKAVTFISPCKYFNVYHLYRPGLKIDFQIAQSTDSSVMLLVVLLELYIASIVKYISIVTYLKSYLNKGE